MKTIFILAMLPILAFAQLNRKILLLSKYQNSAELITVAADRDFSSDTGFWSKNAGWSISSGALIASSAADGTVAYNASLLTSGITYRVTFTVTTLTSGAFKIRGGNVVPTTEINSLGTFSLYVTADGALFGLRASGITSGTIDNVSVIPQ